MNFPLSVCAQLDQLPLAMEAGFDYLEPAFVLVAGMEKTAFEEQCRRVLASPLRAEAMNSMLPGDMVLYGGEEDTRRVCEFVRVGMERAARLGCRCVIFGSGTARQIPEGKTREEAEETLCALLEKMCAIAEPYRIRIAVEPLRAEETNFLHFLPEAAQMASRLPQCRNLGVNADVFHMVNGKEPLSDLAAIGPLLYHAHICTPRRSFPVPGNPEDDAVAKDFLRALWECGYRGGVSVEAIPVDLPTEAIASLAHLRKLMKEMA